MQASPALSKITTILLQWHLHSSVGISAMHMQLLRTNQVIMSDRTDHGPCCNISLPSSQCCRDPSDTVLKVDCTAHSILYDLCTNTFCPLTVQTGRWCSSGSVLLDGSLVQIGGYNDGEHVVCTFTPCNDDNCDWLELPILSFSLTHLTDNFNKFERTISAASTLRFRPPASLDFIRDSFDFTTKFV